MKGLICDQMYTEGRSTLNGTWVTTLLVSHMSKRVDIIRPCRDKVSKRCQKVNALVVSFYHYASQQELTDYIADSGVRCHTLTRSNAATAFPTDFLLVMVDGDDGFDGQSSLSLFQLSEKMSRFLYQISIYNFQCCDQRRYYC